MSFLILAHWPLLFICSAMVVAAVIDGWKLKVPNWLTFPLVLSGWALGLLHSFGLFTTWTGGGDVPWLAKSVMSSSHDPVAAAALPVVAFVPVMDV